MAMCDRVPCWIWPRTRLGARKIVHSIDIFTNRFCLGGSGGWFHKRTQRWARNSSAAQLREPGTSSAQGARHQLSTRQQQARQRQWRWTRCVMWGHCHHVRTESESAPGWASMEQPRTAPRLHRSIGMPRRLVCSHFGGYIWGVRLFIIFLLFWRPALPLLQSGGACLSKLGQNMWACEFPECPAPEDATGDGKKNCGLARVGHAFQGHSELVGRLRSPSLDRGTLGAKSGTLRGEEAGYDRRQ